MERLESDQTPDKASDRVGATDLSERQYACLTYAGEGMSSKEIGRLLGISPSTVDNHIHVAITKLHARNRWHAAQILDPNRRKTDSTPQPGAGLLPPVGGMPNVTPGRRRLVQIATIAATGLIVLTSAVASIVGAIEVFDLN